MSNSKEEAAYLLKKKIKMVSSAAGAAEMRTRRNVNNNSKSTPMNSKATTIEKQPVRDNASAKVGRTAAGYSAGNHPPPSVKMPPQIPVSPKDFVAILSKLSDDGVPRWILGQVEAPPYQGDVDIRLWDKRRDTRGVESGSNPALLSLLERIKEIQEEQQRSLEHASEISAQMRMERKAILAEIEDANTSVRASKAIMKAARADVENIPVKHWQELKSYRVAPEMVSAVLRAVMLLLGEDDAHTWPEMQKVLRDINFKSRITSYLAEMKLSPERREFIIRECVSRRSFRYDRAMKGSLAIGPIYYWVLAQLDSGEAFAHKYKVDKQKLARQRELRAMLRQVHQQAAIISEHHALMDDLDDQLRQVRHQTATSLQSSPSSHSRKRSSVENPTEDEGVVTARYKDTFAGKAEKLYLKPAFFDWCPTNCVLTFLRNTVLCNFGRLPEAAAGSVIEGLDELHVRLLDQAIMERLDMLKGEDVESRKAREREEERQLESQMLQQENPEMPPEKDSSISENERKTPSSSLPTAEPSPYKWETLAKVFDGDKWAGLLEKRREDVMENFTEDIAHCLTLPLDHVVMGFISSTDTLPMEMTVDVLNKNSLDVSTLQSLMDAYNYPKLSALCKEAKSKAQEPESSSQKRSNLVGLPPVSFQGRWWEKVLEMKENEVNQTFTEEAAEALGLTPPQHVSISSTNGGCGGLEFSYVVHESPHAATDAIWLISSFPYPKLWSLYDRMSEELEKLEAAGKKKLFQSAFSSTFEGTDWSLLVRHREREVREAFVLDQSECLSLRPDQIEVKQMNLHEGGELFIGYNIVGDSRDPREVKKQSSSYDYHRMWALYTDLGFVVTSHEIGFEGEGWKGVVENHAAELERRFVSCTAHVLGLRYDEVRNLRFSTGSLYARFDVHHPITLSVEEINEKLKDCPYLPVWDLLPVSDEDEMSYPDSNINREDTLAPGELLTSTTTHELGFESAAWGQVLGSNPLRVKDVVISDTKEALRSFASPQKVVASSLEFVDESLVARIEVTLPLMNGVSEARHHELVQTALEEGSFSSVWELLQRGSSVFPPEPQNTAATTSEDRQGTESSTRCAGPFDRRFPGDRWARILEEVGNPVVEHAFQGDVSDILHIPAEDVVVDGFRIGSLIVSYRIRNLPQEMNQEEVKQRLQDEYRFPRIQSLYKLRALQLSSRRGSMKLGGSNLSARTYPSLTATKDFYGSNWANLVQNHLPLLQRTAIRDIVAARKCLDSNVELQPLELLPTSFSSDPRQGLRLTYDVRPRNPNEKQGDFDVEASNYKFPQLEALSAYPIPGNVVTNSYTVHFDAQEWAPILQKSRPELINALGLDTAEACSIRQEDMLDVDFHTDYDALTANMCIRHDKSISRKKIEKKLFLSTFPHVWGLYGSNTPAESELREFRGVDWQNILKNYEQEMRDAFARDTSNALNKEITESAVIVQEVRSNLQGCCVKYFLPNVRLPFSNTEVAKRLSDDSNYPQVWALYERGKKQESVPRSLVAPPTAPQKLATNGIRSSNHFPGDRWKERLVHHRQAVSEAFQTDVQNALADRVVRESRFEVTVFSLGADASGLTVKHMVTEVPMNRGRSGSAANVGGADGHTDPGFSGSSSLMRGLSATRSASGLNSPLIDNDVENILSAYDYPLLWEVYYRDDSSSGSESDNTWSRVLQRRFEGKHWGTILQNRRGDVHDAFQKGVSDSCGVPHSSVEIISAREGSLLVDYRVMNSPHDGDELDRRVQKHPFPELMSLHPPPTPRLSPPPPVPTIPRSVPSVPPTPLLIRHEISFNGPLWGEVVQRNYQALSQAFRMDVAECLNCTPASLQDIQFSIGKSNLVESRYSVPKIDRSVSRNGEQQLFACVGQLYYPRFPGDQEGEGAQKQAALEKMKLYNFSRVWQLYPRPLGGSTSSIANFETNTSTPASATRVISEPKVEPVTTQHEIYFEGDVWPVVLNAMPDRVRDAVKKDVSRCLSLTHLDSVKVMHVFCLKKDGLIAIVEVSQSSLPRNPMEDANPNNDNPSSVVQSKLRNYPYPAMWGLLDITPKSTVVDKIFPGERWPIVGGQRRETLTEAFRKDMSEMTGLPINYITVQNVAMSTERGLKVSYAVRGSFFPVEKASELASEYSFPNVWNLYNQPSGPIHQCQLTFPGKYWDYLLTLEGFQVALDKAFFSDMKVCFPFADTVYLRGMKASENKGGRLDIFFATEVPAAKYLESRKKMSEYSYPFIWDLYASILENAGGGRGGVASAFPDEQVPSNLLKNEAADVRGLSFDSGEVVTRVGVTFEGPDWPFVWENFQPNISAALQGEVSKATRLPSTQISVGRMQPLGGMMEVVVTIRHMMQYLSKEEITSILSRYPFLRVWEFYERTPDPGRKVTRTKVVFEGDNWNDAVAQHGSRKIENTFVDETESMLNIRPGSINNVRSKVTTEGLTLWCTVHSAPQTEVAKLNKREYPRTWKLYLTQIASEVLKCIFEGDWIQTVKNTDFRSAIEQAFAKDVAMALHIHPEEVRICGFECEGRGNLAIRYRLTYRGLPSSQIQSILSAFEFPDVWELFLGQAEGRRTSGVLQKKFEGNQWSHVINHRLNDIHTAFAKGVSDCCGVPPKSVEILNVSEGSLLVDYRVHNPQEEDPVLDDHVQRHPFPELMALHPSNAPQGSVYPLNGSGKNLSRTRSPPVSLPGAVAPFDPDVPRRGERMERMNMITSEFSKEFLGRGWDEGIQKKYELLELAFQEDTALALCVPLDAVYVTGIRPGMIITCSVQHPAYRTSAELQSILRDYPYDKVWSLYKDRDIATTHELLFYATNWAPVKQNDPKALNDALCSSGSKACDLPLENIRVIQADVLPDKLVATLEVAHPTSMGSDKLEAMLQNYPYDEVWGLLGSSSEQDFRDDLTVSSSSDLYTPSTMVRLFPGGAWEAVSRFHHSAVRSAFIQDSSDCLSVPCNKISVLSMLTAARGLLVHYAVENRLPQNSEDTVNTVNNAPYPRVWALYDELGEDPQIPSTTPLSSEVQMHTIHFPGQNWPPVMRDSRKKAQVADAVRKDCIKALDGVLPSSAVGEPVVKLTEDEPNGPTVVAEVPLQPFSGRSPSGSNAISSKSNLFPSRDTSSFETYDRLLRRYPFPAVWDLYPERSNSLGDNSFIQSREFPPSRLAPGLMSYERKSPERSATTPWLKKHFPGEDWAFPYQTLRSQLEKAFRDDASEATKVPPSNVELRGMELGSLIAEYRIHQPNGTTKEVEQQMEDGIFPRVWALYRPRGGLTSSSPPLSTKEFRSSPGRSSLASTSWTSSQRLFPPATKDPLYSSEIKPDRLSRSLASIQQNEEEQRRAEEAARAAQERAAQLNAEREKALEDARTASRLSAQEKENAQKRKSLAALEKEKAEREAAEAAERARAAAEAHHAAEEEQQRKEREAAAREEAAQRRADEAAARLKEAEEALHTAEEGARRAKEEYPCQVLDAGEQEEELEQIEYLRRALEQARMERDQYQSIVEKGETLSIGRGSLSNGALFK